MTTIALIISIVINIYFLLTRIKLKKMTEQPPEEMTLTFTEGRDGKVIARSDSGKICLLDIAYCKINHIWVAEDEVWRCAVKEERDNALVIQPITRILTAQANFEKKAREFAERGFAQKETQPVGKHIEMLKKGKKKATTKDNL